MSDNQVVQQRDPNILYPLPEIMSSIDQQMQKICTDDNALVFNLDPDKMLLTIDGLPGVHPASMIEDAMTSIVQPESSHVSTCFSVVSSYPDYKQCPPVWLYPGISEIQYLEDGIFNYCAEESVHIRFRYLLVDKLDKNKLFIELYGEFTIPPQSGQARLTLTPEIPEDFIDTN